MYKFSIVYSVGGPATVVDRKTLRTLVDNQKVAETCLQIAALVAQMADCKDEAARRELQDKISALKRGLPALCWHATFRNGKRNSFSAIPSGLAMIDVDHIDEPRRVFEEVRETAIEIGLVAAHVTPSTKGLRMVFAMPEGMTIEGMQRWVTEKLGLQGVDGCTKDLARLSFVVPRSYWLYIDSEALFEGRRINPAAEQRGAGVGEQRGIGAIKLAAEQQGAGAAELGGNDITPQTPCRVGCSKLAIKMRPF